MIKKKFIFKEIYYVAIFLSFAVGLTSGVLVLKNNPYITFDYLVAQAGYYKYKLDFAYGVYSNPFVYNKVESSGKTLPVLVYHGIIPDVDEYNATPDIFASQMRALKEAGYRTVTMKDLKAYADGSETPPPNAFLLTFDDGRKDSYYGADPILKALDFNAVMFVITGKSLGKESRSSKFYLNEGELKQMISSGRWEIESHGDEAHSFYPTDKKGTLGHFYVNKIWLEKKNRLETDREFKERVRLDFFRSKSDLENALGINITGLAFPFGDFGEESLNFPGAQAAVIDSVKDIYDFTFYQYWSRPNDSFRSNYLARGFDDTFVKRISITSKWSPEDLIGTLRASDAIKIPYEETFDNEHRWVLALGDKYIDTEGRALILTMVNGLASAYLDGSFLLDDYDFSVHLYGNSADDAVSLVSRFKDSLNYDECLFYPEFVYVRQVIDGELVTLERVKDYEGGESLTAPEGVNLSMSVEGGNISCSVNGKEVARSVEASVIRNGGVEIKVWNISRSGGRIVVDNITINPRN